MKRRRSFLPVASLIAAVLLGGALAAGGIQASARAERDALDEKRAAGMLIDAGRLRKMLGADGLRILDVRNAEDYGKGHIPGAVRVDMAQWKNLATSDGGLHDRRAWAEKLGRLGIGRTSHVVVYGGALPDAARVWWLLKYVGVKNVSLLDGGWEWWIKKQRPVETSAPEVEPVDFQPDLQSERLEEIGALKESLGSRKVKIVDARSAEEYTGRENRGKRGGHIPGAAHLEWKELLKPDGRFKSREQLLRLFRSRGILPEQTAVCH